MERYQQLMHRREYAFTLLELLVVLLLISLISAVVVPQLGGSLSNLDLKTAAKRVVAALRYTRNQAVTQGDAYTALFDAEKRKLVVSRDGGAASADGLADQEDEGENADVGRENPVDDTKEYLLPEKVVFQKALDYQGEEQELPYAIHFYTKGNSSGGQIILANERGNHYTVSVDFITGLARLEDDADQ